MRIEHDIVSAFTSLIRINILRDIFEEYSFIFIFQILNE